MKDKPCPKCEGFEPTAENWPYVQFCDHHIEEMVQLITDYLDDNPLIFATPAGRA
jgi:hypothetical protein